MSTSLKFVIAQLNFSVGDIQNNVEKIIQISEKAKLTYQPDMVIFPELAISGYPPEDLLLRQDFHDQIQQALETLKQKIKGVDILVGYPKRTANGLFNAACVIREGQILVEYFKQKLPNYGVFDEKRYFSSGQQSCVFPYKGVPVGLIICEDVWYQEPAFEARLKGAKLLLCINASPFDLHKLETREQVLAKRTEENQIPIIYAHFVGGQDELLFDGRSMVMNQKSKITHLAPAFEETLLAVTTHYNDQSVQIEPGLITEKPSEDELAYRALSSSIADYVEKNHIPGVILGLSGGIDSALTLCLAVDALGADRVEAILMPSRFTAQMSIDDAIELANNLGVAYRTLSIEGPFAAFNEALSPYFASLPQDLTEENIQARIRGTLLMALSNKFGKMVLTTSNKSEMAVGYSTLYGDMAGGFAPLKDIYKTEVYRLAHYRNQISQVIPQRIIERAPTAELRENQTDQDSLPPYSMLDGILRAYVEEDLPVNKIVAKGFDEKIVREVILRVERNEYKRRQAPPGPKMSSRAFGRDRRYPITSGYTEFF